MKQFVISIVTVLLMVSNAEANDNPWAPIYDNVPSILVKDPKAALTGSIEDGREPVFEIALKDVGLYFGYIFPPIVVAYHMTDLALKELFSDELPIRGGIRIAVQSDSDFSRTASYITGARPYYFVNIDGPSDFVVDPSLAVPNIYTMVLRRKDTGHTVRVSYDRRIHLPVDGVYHSTFRASVLLVNKAADDPTEDQRLVGSMMHKALTIFDGCYKVESVEDYIFPKTD